MEEAKQARNALEVTLEYMQRDLADIKKLVTSNYVTKSDLQLVKNDLSLIQKIVFATVGTILLTVLVGVLSLVLRKWIKVLQK